MYFNCKLTFDWSRMHHVHEENYNHLLILKSEDLDLLNMHGVKR